MKKIIPIILITFLLFACGGSKTVRTSKKVMKGDWTLNSVSYNTTNTLSVKLLNDASAKCFEGSTWQFIPNNNTGKYAITNTNCSTGERNFIFTIQEIDKTTGLYNFLIKPTDVKGKSETNKGYRLRLSQLSDTSMQWQQTVNANGKPFNISMNFTKL